LVAMTILVFVMAGIFARIHIAVAAASEADRQETAVEEAETIFAELGRSRPLVYGATQGDLPQGAHFEMLISPLRPRPREAPATLMEGHLVTLTMSWPEHGRIARLSFETLRLGAEK
jgi:hypothetical protein